MTTPNDSFVPQGTLDAEWQQLLRTHEFVGMDESGTIYMFQPKPPFGRKEPTPKPPIQLDDAYQRDRRGRWSKWDHTPKAS